MASTRRATRQTPRAWIRQTHERTSPRRRRARGRGATVTTWAGPVACRCSSLPLCCPAAGRPRHQATFTRSTLGRSPRGHSSRESMTFPRRPLPPRPSPRMATRSRGAPRDRHSMRPGVLVAPRSPGLRRPRATVSPPARPATRRFVPNSSSSTARARRAVPVRRTQSRCRADRRKRLPTPRPRCSRSSLPPIRSPRFPTSTAEGTGPTRARASGSTARTTVRARSPSRSRRPGWSRARWTPRAWRAGARPGGGSG